MLLKTPNSEQKQGVIIDEKKESELMKLASITGGKRN